ncbi:diphthine--ammonia ligase [Candidatus Woesearchaeota archaeon]|nr:diphthine--ammonia ligase [Candidatus Woesearchaeota archaeon]
MKIGVLYSGGKDSTLAAFLAKKQGYELCCLIVMKSANPHSYLFDTSNIDLVELQSESMQIPLVFGHTSGKKEEEVEDLKNFVEIAKKNYGIKGLVMGALTSDYKKRRIEKVGKDLGLKIISPLDGLKAEKSLDYLAENNFEVVIVGIANALDSSWLGRKLNKKFLEELEATNKKNNSHIGFEGGEFETFVTDCPLFEKRIRLLEGKRVISDDHNGVLKIVKATLENK